MIVAPVSDGPTFTDPTKHILAANAPVGIRDQDANTAGAQADVVACSNSAGTATLLVGHKGDTSLVQLGGAITTAAAATGDNCPTGFGFVARFAGVTLPESTENADGTLAAATELQVSVASGADSGISPADDVWVDSVAPSLAFASPAGLCGSFTQSATTVTEDVSYTADDALVVATVTNNSVITTYDTPAFVSGVATFGSVAFTEGQNSLVTTESDPAGNATVLAPCIVTIGTAPVVAFTTPTPNAILCPTTGTATGCIFDTDATTPGWQGNLTVHVTASGANVAGSVITFTNGSTTFPTATTDANGDATVTGVTIPEGAQTILATTDNIPGAGVGSGSVAVTVDTLAPNAPTGLLDATIPLATDPLARRKVLMQLSWTAPSDAGGGNVTGYQVRYSKKPIVTQADFDAATPYPFTTPPALPGASDGIAGVTPLYIETDYYFAVEATDIAGTPSPMLTSVSPGIGQTCDCTSGRCCASHFITKTLTGTTGSTTEGAGFTLDGSGDADRDGLSDVVIGSYNGGRAYLFLGNPNFAPSAASVTFTGATGFGRGVSFIGDINNDTYEDLAIANTATNVVYIYLGKATASWLATPMLADTDANFKITADSTYAGSLFGSSMSRLGDFNGDGIDDFAIGSPDFGPTTFAGRVTVVLGSNGGFTDLSLPSATRAITIDGTAFVGLFGSRVLGIGPFYSPTGTNELIVSAPGFTGFASGNGAIYAFRGQAATGGAIPLASADASITGASPNMSIGTYLTDLGTVPNGPPPQLAAGNPSDTVDATSGAVYLFSGTTSTGPFASRSTLSFTGTTLDPFVLIGGGIPGRSTSAVTAVPTSVSFIGDGTPDVVIAPRNGARIAILDGAKTSALGATADIAAAADVSFSLPAPLLLPNNAGGTLIPDVNGDGFADFAISDGATVNAGNTLIFY